MKALVTSSAIILACAPAQYLGRQQDDLLYLIGAQSLLEGRFRLLTVPGTPPLYMIGPGFPALLAPLAFFAGERWWIYQAFCALLLACAPWLIWYWLKRRLDETTAVIIAGLFALSPLVLSQAGMVMSEGPYLLATLGLLIAIESRAPLRASGLLVFLTLARTAAVSLLPGALARSVEKRRWREAALLCAPALAGMAAFSLWSRAVSGSSQQKLEELGVSYSGGIARIPAVIYENAVFYLGSLGQSFLPASWSGLAPLAGLALAVAAAQGALKIWRKDRGEPALWMLAGTALLHLLWPWQYERYWIMPLPFLLWCVAVRLGRAAKPVLLAALACQVLFQSQAWLLRLDSWNRPELELAYGWIERNTSPADIFASAMYVRDGFLSVRPALPLPPAGGSEQLHEVLRSHKVRRVLWQDQLDLGLSLDATSPIRARLASIGASLRDESLFKLVYDDPEEHARVYELR